MVEEIFDEEDKSEFNAGIAALQRCHEAKKYLDVLSDFSNQLEYIKNLKFFYKELHCMMKKNERKIHEPKFKTCRELFNEVKGGEILSSEKLGQLEDWELELRDIEQEKNMNIPKMRDGRWALSRR